METININLKVYESFSSALPVWKIWNFSKMPTKSSRFSTIKRSSYIHRKCSDSLRVPFHNLIQDAQPTFSCTACSKAHTSNGKSQRLLDCSDVLRHHRKPPLQLPGLQSGTLAAGEAQASPAQTGAFRNTPRVPGDFRGQTAHQLQRRTNGSRRSWRAIACVNVVCATASIFISLSPEYKDSKICLNME